jgi:hypothetical protein
MFIEGKNIMKKYIVFVLGFLFVFCALSVIVTALKNPLRESEENMRTNLLKLIPLGTDMQEVIRIVEGKDGWMIRWVSENHGIVVGDFGPDTILETDDQVSIGEKSMRVYLGYYYRYFFLQTDVSAFFAFDENSKLIKIAILKSANVF